MAKPKRLRPGPKPRGAGASGVLALRVTDGERSTWHAAALKQGLTLSEWLREAAELAVARGSSR